MQVNLNTPNYTQPIFGTLHMPTHTKIKRMFGPESAKQIAGAVPRLEDMANGLEVNINTFRDPENTFKGLFISVEPERGIIKRVLGIHNKNSMTNRILVGSTDYRQPTNNMGRILLNKVQNTINRLDATA